MTTAKRYQQIKELYEIAKTETDRAAGALEVAMDDLEKRFKCKTLRDARAKRETLAERAESAERESEEAYAAFVKQWGAVLGLDQSGD